MAESSSSWTLGEYAVSIRSDFRSTASLPPHQQRQIRTPVATASRLAYGSGDMRPQHAADATRRYPTLFRLNHSHAAHFVICKRSIVDGHIVDHAGIADGEQGHADFSAEDGLAIPEGKRQYAL